MANEVADFLSNNSGDFNPGFKFTEPGETCKGTIIGDPHIVDGMDLNDKPQRSLVVDIETAEGAFALWLPSGKGVTRSVSKAAPDGLAAGGKLAVKYTGDGEPPKPGFHPPKLFEAKYEAPAAAAVDLSDF